MKYELRHCPNEPLIKWQIFACPDGEDPIYMAGFSSEHAARKWAKEGELGPLGAVVRA